MNKHQPSTKYPDGWWKERRPEEEHVYYDDFRAFVWMLWDHLGLPDPTPVQLDIATYLQGGPRRRMIEAFRGVGKSWITSGYVCWLLLRNPDHKVLVVSASKDRSDAFSVFTRRLISEVPMLQHLEPREGQRSSSVAFDVGPAKPDHAPSVKSVGIFGQLAGSRADTIVPDDIEVPANSLTQPLRDKLAEAVKEFDAILKPGGEIVYLGTPQSEMTVYNLLTERGYEIRIWPARVPRKDQVVNYGGKLAPFIEKMIEDGTEELTPTDPKRFDDRDLLERELSYGRSGFALQFMLDTRLSDLERYPLRLKDLIVYTCRGDKGPIDLTWGADTRTQLSDELPMVGLAGDNLYGPIWTSQSEAQGYAKFDQTIMWIDPSGRGKDETAVVILKHLQGRLFLTHCEGFRGDGYGERVMAAIKRMVLDNNITYIGVESNYGDGMFENILQSYLRADDGKIPWLGQIEGHKVTGMKEARIIDVLEPVLNQHRLVIDPEIVNEDYKSNPDLPPEMRSRYMLLYQLTRITREKGALVHDDRLDCLAQAVGWFIESMARDVSVNLEKAQTDKIVEEAISGLIAAKTSVYQSHVISSDPKAQKAELSLIRRSNKLARGFDSRGVRLRRRR